MRIAKHKPEADGIPFDDIQSFRLSPDAAKALMARGLVFVTEFHEGEARYGGNIIASGFHEAARICDARGLGEHVVGRLEEVIPVDGDEP